MSRTFAIDGLDYYARNNLPIGGTGREIPAYSNFPYSTGTTTDNKV
jgi:hypothetical protein